MKLKVNKIIFKFITEENNPHFNKFSFMNYISVRVRVKQLCPIYQHEGKNFFNLKGIITPNELNH